LKTTQDPHSLWDFERTPSQSTLPKGHNTPVLLHCSRDADQMGTTRFSPGQLRQWQLWIKLPGSQAQRGL